MYSSLIGNLLLLNCTNTTSSISDGDGMVQPPLSFCTFAHFFVIQPTTFSIGFMQPPAKYGRHCPDLKSDLFPGENVLYIAFLLIYNFPLNYSKKNFDPPKQTGDSIILEKYTLKIFLLILLFIYSSFFTKLYYYKVLSSKSQI